MASNGNGKNGNGKNGTWKKLKKRAGFGLSDKEKKERRKSKMKALRTKTEFSEQREKLEKSRAKRRGYEKKHKPKRGDPFSPIPSAIGGSFSSSRSYRSGNGGYYSGGSGLGVYSPYGSGKTIQPLTARKRKIKRKPKRKRKVYYEYR